MNKGWLYALKGLAAAAISSAASGALLVLVDPEHFNFQDWHRLVSVAGAFGLVGALNYLKQPPKPDDAADTIHPSKLPPAA